MNTWSSTLPNTVYETARTITDNLPDDAVVPFPNNPESSLRLINHKHEGEIAEHFHSIIANVIANLINAGSERDAVMENEGLYAAIKDEIHGWTDHPDNDPGED